MLRNCSKTTGRRATELRIYCKHLSGKVLRCAELLDLLEVAVFGMPYVQRDRSSKTTNQSVGMSSTRARWNGRVTVWTNWQKGVVMKTSGGRDLMGSDKNSDMCFQVGLNIPNACAHEWTNRPTQEDYLNTCRWLKRRKRTRLQTHISTNPTWRKKMRSCLKRGRRTYGDLHLSSWVFHDLRLRFDLPFYMKTCQNGMKPFAFSNAFNCFVHDIVASKTQTGQA